MILAPPVDYSDDEDDEPLQQPRLSPLHPVRSSSLSALFDDSVASLGTSLTFRRISTGHLVHSVPMISSTFHLDQPKLDVCFSGVGRLGPEENALAFVEHGSPFRVCLMDMTTCQIYHQFLLLDDCPRHVVVLDPYSERRFIAAADPAGQVAVWDVVGLSLKGVLQSTFNLRSAFQSLSSLHRRHRLFCSTSSRPDFPVVVIDSTTIKEVAQVSTPHTQMCDRTAVSEEHDLGCIMSDDGTVTMWDGGMRGTDRDSLVAHVEVSPGKYVGSGTFLDDRNLFVTTNSDDIFYFDVRMLSPSRPPLHRVSTPLTSSYRDHIWDQVQADEDRILFVGETVLCLDVDRQKILWHEDSEGGFYGAIRVTIEQDVIAMKQLAEEERERIGFWESFPYLELDLWKVEISVQDNCQLKGTRWMITERDQT